MNMLGTVMLLYMLGSPVKLAVVQSATSDATQAKTMAGELSLLPGIRLSEGWKAPIRALTPADMRALRNVMKNKSLDAVVLMLSSGYVLLGTDFLAGPWTVVTPLPRSFMLALKNLERRIKSEKKPPRSPVSKQNRVPSEETAPSEPPLTKSSGRHKKTVPAESDAPSWRLAIFVGTVSAAIVAAILGYQYYSYDDDVDVRVFH